MNDFILRQDAIDAVYERIKQIGYENSLPILSIGQAIRDLPSAQPKTGWWVDDNGRPYNGKPNNSCWCSECGEWLVASDEYSVSTNFCPNCGARMLNGGEK